MTTDWCYYKKWSERNKFGEQQEEINSYLIDVGVPHFSEEPEGGWGVGVIDRKLDTCLEINKQVFFNKNQVN